MVKKTIMNLSIISSILLLSGCSTTNALNDINNDYEEQSKNVIDEVDNKNYLKDKIKEIRVKKEFIALENGKSVKDILLELNDLNGINYFLKSEDILITPNKTYKGIKDLNTLIEYIELTTNKTLVVTKNAFMKDKLQIVEVFDKDSILNNFDNISITLEGKNYTLDDTMKEISKISNFSIIFKPDLVNEKYASQETAAASGDASGGSSATNSSPRVSSQINNNNIKEKIILFKEGNITKLLNHIEIEFNIFIDIDYRNKNITLSRYNMTNIPFVIFNKQVSKEGSSSSSSGSSSSSSGSSSSSSDSGSSSSSGGGIEDSNLETNLKVDPIVNLEKKLVEITNSLNNINGEKNNIYINRASSEISIYGTKNFTKTIKEIVNKFNDNLKKHVEVNLYTIELLNNNSNSYQLNFDNLFKNANMNLVSSYTGFVASGNNGNLSYISNDAVRKGSFGANNEMYYIAKISNNKHMLRNQTPFVFKDQQEISYVKSVSGGTIGTQDIAGTPPTPETSTVTLGTNIFMLPNINGEDVSLYLNPSYKVLLDRKKESYSAGEYTSEIDMLDIGVRKIENELTIKNNEKVIISSYTTYEDSDKYEGILPIKNLIIGGGINKNKIRKEIIYLMELKLK